MSDSRIRYQKTISSILRNLASAKEEVQLQDVIDRLQNIIVDTYDVSDPSNQYKLQWLNRIIACSEEEKITISSDKPSWKKVEKEIAANSKHRSEREGSNDQEEPISTPSTTSTRSTYALSLQVRLSVKDKSIIKSMLCDLDHKLFWTLQSTAFQTGQKPKAVEEKVKDFAMKCNFWHPSQSLILDVDDANWKDKASPFSLEELQEIREYGPPILRAIPQDIAERLKEISTLKSAQEAYSYGRSIEHDPVAEPLLSWLAIALMDTASYFVKDNSGEIADMLESDRMYNLWGFINKIFKGTGIHAISKENASVARSSKRKLSAIDPSGDTKMGHRIDTIYCGSNIELGGLEIGKESDDTEEMDDGMLTLPIVLKDMLSSVINTMPSLAHRVHVLGYYINGNSITMLDVDIPDGFVTRIRRSRELTLPTCSRDYVPRMVPLLELALWGKLLLEETLEEIQCTTVSASDATSSYPVIPGCFIPSSLSSAPSSSSLASSSSSKKQCV